MRITNLLAAALAAGATVAAGCSNTTKTATDLSTILDMAKPLGMPGGPIMGAMDTHCNGDGGLIIQPTNQADCMYSPDGGGDAAPDYGDTMWNTSGDDDDCKYHVSWSVAPNNDIYENGNTTFVVVATNLGSNTPLTGANPVAEVDLGTSHVANTTNMKTVESPPGTYTIGPVIFDQPSPAGAFNAATAWFVRFHFYENCLDFADDSPHGHAAFYINIP